MVEKKFEEPIALPKWSREMNITIPDITKTFIFAKLSTNDSKLLTFNYKLINRLINNRANLFRWNIVTDPNCTLCEGGQIDNTYHAIMQCKWTFDKIKIILENLDPSRAWAKFIDHKKWVFGTCDPAINLIILIMKSHICQVRSGNKEFSITALKKEIFLHILAEKTYLPAVRFNRKWLNFIPLVDESVQFGSKNEIYNK